MADYSLSAELSAKDAGMASTFNSLVKQLDDVSETVERMKLGETINNATSLAQTSLDRLSQSYKSGQIDAKQYEDATRGIQHAFGLVTPESENAAAQMEDLHRRYTQGEISAQEYEQQLVRLSRTLDQVGDEGKQTGGILTGMLQGAMMGVGQAAMGMVQQLPAAAIDLARLGAESQRAKHSLDQLAQSAGSSGTEILEAIQKASDHTVDRMSAMSAANKAMMLDVAKTPAEFERLTRVAVALGRAMGQDAAKSIDDFTVAAGRQSMMIADNLGLVVKMETAQENYAATLSKTADELTDTEKKQSFLNEMLRQGEIKLSELGAQSLDSAGKTEKAAAAWSDAKVAIGEILINTAELTGALDALSSQTTLTAGALQTLNEQGFSFNAWWASIKAVGGGREAQLEAYRRAMEDSNETMRRTRLEAEETRQAFIDSFYGIQKAAEEVSPEIDRYKNSVEQAQEVERYGYTTSFPALKQEIKLSAEAMEDMASETKFYATANGLMQESVSKSTDSWHQYDEAMRQTEESQNKAAIAALDLQKRTEQAAEAANVAAGVQLGLSLSLQSQMEAKEQNEERAVERREELEAQHTQKLEELRKRGQSTAIRMDAAAEQEKLVGLRRSLEIALVEQSAYTDKTSAATQMRKDDAIAKMQGQIADQEKLLDDYHSGRLVKAGENVTGLIAEENRLHQERLKALDEEMKKQNEMQEKAMGQWMLNAFDAWAGTKDIPEEQKSEWVKKTIEMRTSIAEEYGLVSAGMSEMVSDMWSEWDTWATDMDMSTADVATYLSRVTESSGAAKQELMDMTAHDWWVRVRYEISVPDFPDLPGLPSSVTTGRGERSTRGVPQGEGYPQGNIYDSHDTVNIYSEPGAARYMHERNVRRAQLSALML